jgi:predicted methyltransferase
MLIEKLKRNNLGLSDGEIEGILFVLLSGGSLTKTTGLPKETLRGFKKSIASYLSDASGDGAALTEEGKEELRHLGLRPYLWSFGDLMRCDKGTIEKFTSIREEYKKRASRELDQFYALPETSVKKAQVMIARGEVVGKNIALIGDDDMVSLALILLEGGFRSLTIFDVDNDLLTFIKTKTTSMGIDNVHTVHYDCRDELKDEYSGRFDVVLTDPPYTRYGAELFLERALEMVGGGASSDRKIFFFYGNSSRTPEKFLKIQEIIGRTNLVIEDKISNFAHYAGAESIGSASSLYILKTLPSTTVYKGIRKNRKIYTYETEKEERFPFVDHVVLKVFGVSTLLLESKRKMLGLLNDFCRTHRLRVVDTKITEFKGKGFTFVYVLSNSNLTVHTWPEHNALHVDLITCSPIFDKPSLPKTISDLFNTDAVEVNFIE